MRQLERIVDPSNVATTQFSREKYTGKYAGKIDYPSEAAINVRDCFRPATPRVFGASHIAEGPQAHYVQLPSETSVAAHFHPVDQFQLYLGSEGAWYQRSGVGGCVLHYTDAYATYGPFGTKGPESQFEYVTLRAQSTDISGWMPEDRAMMPRRGQRNYLIPIEEVPVHKAESSDTKWDAILRPEEDGLAVYRGVVANSMRVVVPEVSPRSAGQFYYVLAGGIRVDDKTKFPATSLIWQQPGDYFPELVADGFSGCDMLVMHFPQSRP